MIIFDSSTIILLSKIEILELFISNFHKRILIPEKVKFEICREGKQNSLLIYELIENRKIIIKEAKNKKQINKLMEDFNIEEGEAEVLALAIQEDIKIIATDDRNAIKACKILKIDFITAITILIRAFEKGLFNYEIALIKLERLKAFGRYSDIIINNAKGQIKRSEKNDDKNIMHTNK